MNKRNLPFLILALLVLAAGGLLLTGRFSGDDPLQASAAHPTPVLGNPVQTVGDALNVARKFFTASPPLAVHEIESVVYVESTVGEARALFDPEGEIKAWIADDALPAWVVVAEGKFHTRVKLGVPETRPLISVVWVVVPRGDINVYWSIDRAVFDLSQLGTVVEVPVPLAEFPEPVQLE